jgi:hypothetical protein
MSSLLVTKNGSAYSTRDYRSLEKNSVDAIFVGASSFWSGASPMMIWAKSGVTSYVFGSSRMPARIQHYMLKEALETQTPKVAFLGVQFLVINQDLDKDTLRVFQGLTTRPWTPEKIRTILDIYQDTDRISLPDMLSPLLREHQNWKEIEPVQFLWEEPSFTMGQRWPDCYREDFSVVGPGKMRRSAAKHDKEDYQLDQENLRYYEASIELCQERGVQPVLLTFPLINNTTNPNAISDLAKKYDISYVNFNDPELFQSVGLDLADDFRDDRHVNIWGAMKLADYFGGYIRDDFGGRDIRKDDTPVSRTWQKEYRTFYEQYGMLLPEDLPPPT